MQRTSTSDWTTIDHAVDPNAFVGYLDTIQSQDQIRAYKRKTFELLNLRPGTTVLDIGCGTGEDVQAMARLVAPTGRAVGIDNSSTMIDEARHRAGELGDYRVGDAQQLDFDDGSFDGARADRVFQHLEHPKRALEELIRVTRKHGRIVVADTDWGTLAVDGPDPDKTRTVLREVENDIRNPWMGRQLLGLVRQAGLRNIEVYPETGLLTSFELADKLLHLSDGVRRARERGTLTAEESSMWTRWQLEASAAGRFCALISLLIVSGRRP